MRITCIIKELACGGAQKILLILSDYLNRRGHAVTFLYNGGVSEGEFYDIPQNLKKMYFHPDASRDYRWYNLAGMIRRTRACRQSILETQPDVAISFVDICNINVLMALSRTSVPVVVSERCDPTLYHIPWRWNLLRRIYYPKADCVVVQSKKVQDWSRNLWPAWKTQIIPNMVLPPKPVVYKKLNGDDFALINIGRLVKQKRQDHIIQAFASLTNDFKRWRLYILGEGHLRSSLEAEIQKYNLQNKVTLLGSVKAPEAYLAGADLFIFSSLFEGFPNAIAEAMSYGLPAVSYDCPSGPDVIIRHEIDGLLVENGNVDALRDSMARLMANDEMRKEYGIRAKEVTERFHPDRIVDQWEDVLKNVLENRVQTQTR